MTLPLNDPFDLERFVVAQCGSYAAAIEELRGGKKRSHWMWFVFPQVAGLGTSAASQRYALRSLDEAAAYLAHPILGPRLRECVEALLTIEGKTAEAVMGYPDNLKLQSSMTLFRAADANSSFQKVLDRYFAGVGDSKTTEYLASHG